MKTKCSLLEQFKQDFPATSIDMEKIAALIEEKLKSLTTATIEQILTTPQVRNIVYTATPPKPGDYYPTGTLQIVYE